MWFYTLKVIISALIIIVVSEVAKFNATLGGLIKSFVWLYIDTKDVRTDNKCRGE